ncbi:Bug family tripartite tricarboxylate transporter substrate binding protein [Achromobacter marplatensis]|uniref:Bug family tripartite tricarboxylate transporter substrate binding protein n=1 Tax=Achromobacter marplatensis TaxID=470868 RepID=UPI000277F2AD|nr:tripartite tricarboxylate transporter substrate binding protein [Achromobacter marplatensis]EJO33447.1 extra-cytoplasmic solute receptor family protein 126 [Achromobacter marplatensis]
MKVLSKVAALALAAGIGAGAHAAFPERPVRLVVPFGAGGITDIVARQVGKGMGDVLGQSIVIENRPGAGGMIAAQVAATAPADGYTIFMGTVGTQVVNPLIYSKLSYDADKFAPVGMVSGSPYVLAVRAGLPAASFSEFVAYAKANPARLNFGSAGNASSPHLGLELLKLTAGLDIVHVPFKSGSEAVNAAIGEQVDVVMDASPVIMPHVASGKLRALAVAADKRLPSAPAVPASTEVGDAQLQISSWNAFFAPAGTPPEVLAALNAALQKTLASPELKERLAAQGTQLYTGTPQEYQHFIAGEKTKWTEIVKRANIKMD